MRFRGKGKHFQKVQPLVDACELLKGFVSVAPNTMLPIKKLDMAILKEKAGPGGTAEKNLVADEAFSERIGTAVRILLSWVRDIKRYGRKRVVLLRKVASLPSELGFRVQKIFRV